MKLKLRRTMTLLLVFVVQLVFAQKKTVSGNVSDNSGPLPGVVVLIKGTTQGTETDFDGNYSIEASKGQTIQFSYIGMKSSEQVIGDAAKINVVLEQDTEALDEVVVTALGVTREKKSIGYASQQVAGEDIAKVKVNNVVNSLSGKVSGVQIKANNNFGGSSNFLIRGVSSLQGNNQPLFVVDGIPISNRLNNSSQQRSGRKGYDYGNAASDINPDDVASINVLKGAAASAIYGSRGANGVVIITTKKGKKGAVKVTLNSSTQVGSIDESTFIKYQDGYGAGYGAYYDTGYFNLWDMDGNGQKDNLVVPTQDDASYGGALDGSLVYQWDAFVPEHRNFGKATPYVASTSTPLDFFETALQFNNSVNVSGGNDIATYKIGYTNQDMKGFLPNATLNKNTVNLNGTLKINDKLSVGSNANVIIQRTVGRNSTGYGDNIMAQFRQWWQVNVDVKDQKDIYFATKKNYSWNHEGGMSGPGVGAELIPHYFDNPYWTRYENYQNDSRNRFFGNVFANYQINDWVSMTVKGAVDTYSEMREERRAVGSVATEFGILRDDETSGYDRTDINFAEYNYDVMFNFAKEVSEDLNINGIAGINIRREKYNFLRNSTAGGLVIPRLYSLSNSKSSNPKPIETLSEKQVNGFYAQASIGYKGTYFLDLTDRYDISSALPAGNNEYNYYAASTSIILSNLFEADWLNFAKLRAGYAEVGNDLPALNVYDTFATINNFGDASVFSYEGTKNNSELKPERTKEIEAGLEAKMFNNRFGFDISLYRKNTVDQLMPVSVTTSTGFSNRWVNAGEIENKGIELGLNGDVLKSGDFNWNVVVNWAKNENLVVDLYGDQENLQLSSFQGGISVNATVGQPYGSLRGTGFQYHENGQRIVSSSGYYVAQADQVIGDMNPDWTGGITNTLSYKDLSLSFLIDIQKGGDVFSLDTYYGQGTGLPYYTIGTNDLGNPVRNTLANGGGIVLDGVYEDGTPNTTRVRADFYGGAYYWGNSSRNPKALNVYDASFVKLRELSLNYDLPINKWTNGAISGGSLSLIGRNLWIIHKNVPFADPESGLGAGNSQGYLSGSFPTLRTIGLNLNLEF
ncbi:MAG: SusC/RagA family TonB-linked outer membrane protein [Flavicella sp.]